LGGADYKMEKKLELPRAWLKEAAWRLIIQCVI
jgi:hypothetical protein